MVDISIYTERKQRDFQKDLRELEKSIYPEYEEIAKNITIQKADLDKNSNKLSVAINKHGNDLHRKINAIIQKMIFDLNEMDSKYLAVLNKKKHDEITRTISEITHNIAELKKLLDCNDSNLVLAYKSRNAEFSRLPSKLPPYTLNFTPNKINIEILHQQFGSLSPLPNTTLKPLLVEPRVISTIKTHFGVLSCLTCQKYEGMIWASHLNSNKMTIYNLNGELVKSI